MKKFLFISFGFLAAIVLTVSCNQKVDPQTPSNDPGTPSAEKMTITATLSDALTKVTFDPAYDSNSKPTGMAHAWQSGDKLRITNASSESEEFELVRGEGSDTGVFSGNSIDGGPFTVEAVPVSHPGSTDASQAQLADGSTAHLLFVASATGVTDLSNIELTETSNIIGFVAKLPAGAAATINELEIEKSVDDFEHSDKLNITIASQEDVDNDGILKVYANVPASWSIAANTKMFLRFKSTNTAHTVYTRYQEFASAVTPQAGKFNYIKINCSNIDKYAGGADAGTATAPYLIADPYQLASVNGLAAGGSTTYFKLIDNIDMTGVTHNHINTNSGYTQVVSFNGNGKTISNLGKDLFYVFKGSVYDLTLDKSIVSARGILAEFIQGPGNEITNVTVSNGEVTSTSNNVGGLVGQINSGTSGQTTVTITDCTVSSTNVKGASVVGGFVGYANELVSISGCKYTGGTVEASARYCGGFVGSTGNYSSVFSNCQVELATVKTTHTDDSRCGGFVGQLQTSCQIKGCTVGTSSIKVTVSTPQPESGKVLNSGGFVGVNYGTITKNGNVNSKAYAKITSANTQGQQLNLGGFVGFARGTIEYSDAIVDMNSLQGQYIGGFAGYVTNAGTVIDNCTINGSVKGNNYTGGFAGYVDSGAPAISNCSASGSVLGQSGSGGFVGQTMTGVFTNCSTSATCSFSGSNNGGFAGQVHGGSITKCHAEADITETSSGTVYGGFVGLIPNGTVSIKRCYATGNVTSDGGTISSFVGSISQGTGMTLSSVTIENCYGTGNIINSNQIRGGLVGVIGTASSVSISNCYASGAVVGSFRLGGLIGNVNNANATVDHCAAWNSEVTASSVGPGNWSSGAVVGTAFPTCTLTDNYRKPSMTVKAFWGNVSGTPGTNGYTWELTSDYNHPNVSSSSPLIICEKSASTFTLRATTATALASGQDNYPIFPYHGLVEAGKTLSQLASTTLGWSSDIWDFTGDLPTLK